MKKKVLLGADGKCKGCGGDLKFCPSKQDLICKQCSSHQPIAKIEAEKKHTYVPGILDYSNKDWGEEQKVMKCKSCGAEIVLAGFEIAKVCPYCASEIVALTKALPGLKPDNVIPFAIDENEAGKVFAMQVKKKFFAPRAFKKKLPESKIHGVYIPSFLFDASSVSSYKGILANDREESDDKGNTRTVTDYQHISGNISLEHKDVVVESSGKIDQKTINSIIPFNHKNECKFDYAFVRGFSVEHYDDSLDDCYKTARSQIDNQIKHAILSRYDYDRVVSLKVNSNVTNEQYAYTLIPVYNFEYNFKKKNYITSMNGQTGKVGKGLPVSKVKVFFSVFGVIMFIMLFVFLFFVSSIE